MVEGGLRQGVASGATVGRYRVAGRLAVGGMAEVYLAEMSGLDGFARLVVLKRLLPTLAEHEGFVRMFLDEARLGALLHHPNVVQVLDVGRDGEVPFMVLEYVAARNLRAVQDACSQAGRVMPLECALHVVIAAAAGLHYAHERRGTAGRPLGIVHRDVTPANLLVTYDGCVKVTDFGIAKTALRSSRTRTGLTRGTTAYMSPEQVRGRRLDRRSDVFSLGILLYELTTGTRLFEGTSEYEVLHGIVTAEVPRPSRRRRGYPRELESIVQRALAPDPARRYATAGELQGALERCACARKLGPSPLGLAALMRALFPGEGEAVPALDTAGLELVTRTPPAAGPGLAATPADDDAVPAALFSAEMVTRPLPATGAPRRRRVVRAGVVAAAVAALAAGLVGVRLWERHAWRTGAAADPAGLATTTAPRVEAAPPALAPPPTVVAPAAAAPLAAAPALAPAAPAPIAAPASASAPVAAGAEPAAVSRPRRGARAAAVRPARRERRHGSRSP
ncbi:MAG TPA: serine/threonine-protein kinase [Polyangia bacterium]|jgi:hypothetical protein